MYIYCIYIYISYLIYGFFRKFFYPKSSLILVYMGLRFFPLSFGGSCPNTYTFHQQKIHFLARVSSARHIQSLDVDEELLLSVSFSFSKFILPRFLAAFLRLFASCLSYLAIFFECVTGIFNFYVMP